MELIACPHCHTRVIPKTSGECPACGQATDKAAAVPVEAPLRRSEDPEDNPYRVGAAADASRDDRIELQPKSVTRTHRVIRWLGLTNRFGAAFLILLAVGSLWFLSHLGIQGIAQRRESALSDLGYRARARAAALDRPPSLARPRLVPDARPGDPRPDDPLRPRRFLGARPDTRRRRLDYGGPGRVGRGPYCCIDEHRLLPDEVHLGIRPRDHRFPACPLPESRASWRSRDDHGAAVGHNAARNPKSEIRNLTSPGICAASGIPTRVQPASRTGEPTRSATSSQFRRRSCSHWAHFGRSAGSSPSWPGAFCTGLRCRDQWSSRTPAGGNRVASCCGWRVLSGRPTLRPM